jgi:hypothetical protein
MGENVGLPFLPFKAQCTIIHSLRAKDQESICDTRGKSTG